MGPNYYLVQQAVLAVQIILGAVVVEAQNTNFSFAPFSNTSGLLTINDSVYDAGSSSFLLNSKGAGLLTASCGWLLYDGTVRMRDSASGAVASFHTAFTFKITGIDYYYDSDGWVHGDGIAFTFARNSSFTGQSSGGSLCLVNAAATGQASERVFAVEFDTFRNPEHNDSSDSHIGIDLNSVNSTWSYNLCGKVRNCSYLCNTGYFTAWIDYDSPSQNLQVFFADGSLTNNILKPTQPVINASLAAVVPLTQLVDDYMYVGFSGATGEVSEVHEIQSWEFTSSGMPEQRDAVIYSAPSSSGRKVGIITGVSVGVVAAFLVLCFFVTRHRRRSSHNSLIKQGEFCLVDQNLVPRMFTYKELSKATKKFRTSELLGRGGFGAVYKATLPSGALVAVKRMRMETRHGQESFQAEIASLGQIRHRHLVQLRGWCHDREEEELLLVYNFMDNGSLDEWLYHFSKRNAQGLFTLNGVEALPLILRHSILSGVAAALAYLHEGCPQCVLHRDIKSSNVLLDKELNAYLGDFGLARLIDHQKMEKTTMMAGTLGYMAPEMSHTGKATKESDVYSFGVLTLEVMCGVRPLDTNAIERGDGILVDRVWRAHEAGNILEIADSRLRAFPLSSDMRNSALQGEIELQEASHILAGNDGIDRAMLYAPNAAMEDTKLITSLLHLGLLCCNPNPENRPGMRVASQLLQTSEDMDLLFPPLPAYKPEARFSGSGFSRVPQLATSEWSSFSGVNVQDGAVRESSQSTPSSSGVSSAEPVNNMQRSFAAPESSLISGR